MTLAISLVLFSCAPREQKVPLGSVVGVSISNPFELEPTAPLRFAVVFTTAESFMVAYDGVVASLTDSFLVPLEVPSPELQAQLFPRESLELLPGLAVDAYRPRILVYEDVDRSGDFDPPALDREGPDRILAIDVATPSVAMLLDLEGTLDGLSIEATELYYRASGDVFTPFVRAVDRSGSLGLAMDSSPVSLSVSDSQIPETRFSCLRGPVTVRFNSLFATSRVAGFVDSGFERESVCGAIFPNCDTVDLASMQAPALDELETDQSLRVLQCRPGQFMETLIVQTAEMACEDCVCTKTAHADVYFASPEALPEWWPCGIDVNVCESDLPLYFIDVVCEIEARAQEAEEEAEEAE